MRMSGRVHRLSLMLPCWSCLQCGQRQASSGASWNHWGEKTTRDRHLKLAHSKRYIKSVKLTQALGELTCSSLVYSWKHWASEQVWGCWCCSFTWRTLSASGMYSSSVLLNKLWVDMQNRGFTHAIAQAQMHWCQSLRNYQVWTVPLSGTDLLTSLLSLCPTQQQFWHEVVLPVHKTWRPCALNFIRVIRIKHVAFDFWASFKTHWPQCFSVLQSITRLQQCCSLVILPLGGWEWRYLSTEGWQSGCSSWGNR